MARDVERLDPAAVVGAAGEFTDEMRAVLRKQGIAAIALSDMDAAPVPGFEKCERREIEIPESPRRLSWVFPMRGWDRCRWRSFS